MSKLYTDKKIVIDRGGNDEYKVDIIDFNGMELPCYNIPVYFNHDIESIASASVFYEDGVLKALLHDLIKDIDGYPSIMFICESSNYSLTKSGCIKRTILKSKIVGLVITSSPNVDHSIKKLSDQYEK